MLGKFLLPIFYFLSVSANGNFTLTCHPIKQNDGYSPPFTLPERLHHIQMRIEFTDRIIIHRLEHICICIERNVYVCMTKPGLKDYRRDS